jgi:serine/threonine protein kinase
MGGNTSLEQAGIKKTGTLLGKGAYGNVYKGQAASGALVAIKEIDKRQMKAGASRADTERETNLLKMFRHPNIVMLHGVHEDAQNFQIVLDFCDGGDLESFIYMDKDRPAAPAKRKLFAKDVLTGIYEMHRQNVIHRDIKPANILIAQTDSRPICKIADFGVSDRVDPTKALSAFAGTPAFMAPEQNNKQGYNLPVDIWAAGITSYMLFNGGKHPFLKGGQLDFAAISRGMGGKPANTACCFPVKDFGKDQFVYEMLVAEPRRRPRAHDCLANGYLQSVSRGVILQDDHEFGDTQAFLCSEVGFAVGSEAVQVGSRVEAWAEGDWASGIVVDMPEFWGAEGICKYIVRLDANGRSVKTNRVRSLEASLQNDGSPQTVCSPQRDYTPQSLFQAAFGQQRSGSSNHLESPQNAVRSQPLAAFGNQDRSPQPGVQRRSVTAPSTLPSAAPANQAQFPVGAAVEYFSASSGSRWIPAVVQGFAQGRYQLNINSAADPAKVRAAPQAAPGYVPVAPPGAQALREAAASE